ncbi:uncharacterized protein LACBIDRAFT_328221 [Laccaria bicolor S238N-H82]|uniref:Predicted protein n=1 Tax=Laccaria bicolor (strain S238N-H82 / ATCC MYA-4686) TaxID=486041 RepID=B0DE43_LACBS|nr:uncharacterized protein LACBIDRAFT_328221 [Laccaria bicolor S238N-H82]EDR07202.1 predicted protein [Laccaria bicolor S238N-H82]|eukprot:XP_001882133.1 predicted protein [Laccaria bicolor S238N-H82]
MSPLPSSTASLDGKGSADSAAKGGKSMKKMGPSYVYYCLYTKLGAFESNHAHNNTFIGRIPSKLFAPPHTVVSIKQSLCKFEGLSESDKALLFIPLSSPAPKNDSAHLPLKAPSGLGLSEHDPIALIVESEKRTKEVLQSKNLTEQDDTDVHWHYGKSCRLYYHVYLLDSKGEEKAKTSFDESDLSLGHINTLSVAPPHTTGSLKARITKVEGLVMLGHAHYKNMELFQDTDDDAAMSDTDVISFQGDTYPGSDEADPVALVNATANTEADQKAKFTPDTVATNPALSDGPDSKFTKHAQLCNNWDYHSGDSAWLSIIKDEIVHTDGVILSKIYTPDGASCISFLFCFITSLLMLSKTFNLLLIDW